LAKEIVSREIGVHDDYFLVAAVKLAKSQRDKLPNTWIGLAHERLQLLQSRQGFGDERELLMKAIKAWKRVHPDDGKPAGFAQKLIHAFLWPGTKWIPTQPDAVGAAART
jgi:hypothetical protein